MYLKRRLPDMTKKQITNMHKLKNMTPEKLADKLKHILSGDVLYRTMKGTVVDFGGKTNNQGGVI